MKPVSIRACHLAITGILAFGAIAEARSLNRRPHPSKREAREPAPAPATPAESEVEFPEGLDDPFEPVNRLVWGANKIAVNHALRPLAKGIKFVLRKPTREGMNNFARNLYYPGRVINLGLQGRWEGARIETSRFLTNTTLGIAGIYDPATKKKNMPMADADFGQTLSGWGWDTNTYLMLPGAGPSNPRDVVGRAGDSAARPLNYFPDWGLVHPGLAVVNHIHHADTFKRFTASESDSYAFLKLASSYSRRNQIENYRIEDEPAGSPLETLYASFFTYKDRKFPNRARTHSASIHATGKKLKFTCWLQEEPAPIVYIVPGLGSHHFDRASIALAELAFNRGYSVATLSSAFHPEFMEHAATSPVPAYAPEDSRNVYDALSAIDTRLNEKYPGRIGSRSLLGYSMGGFHCLVIAAQEAESVDSLLFPIDRFIAINPPVRLLHGMSKLDAYYDAPLAWDPEVRAEKIDQVFLKVAGLAGAQAKGAEIRSLPFDETESKFLIGFLFRKSLRDTIFASQRIENLGVLEQPIKPLRRASVYREISRYSFADYLDRFVVPYYASREADSVPRESFEKAVDLRYYAAGLRANPDIRLIMTRNDFLLAPGDLSWLQSVVPSRNITLFDRGGHMGHLAQEAAQSAIINALAQ